MKIYSEITLDLKRNKSKYKKKNKKSKQINNLERNVYNINKKIILNKISNNNLKNYINILILFIFSLIYSLCFCKLNLNYS